MMAKQQAKIKDTVNAGEIRRFSALAQQWWDPHGPMAPLHKLNPTRLIYLQQQIEKHFPDSKPAALSVLDIGCGAGLVSENLAALGYAVTGVDASEALIQAAALHAQNKQHISPPPYSRAPYSREGGNEDIVNPCYRVADVETLAQEKKRFDIVLALEVIEHVDNPQAFLASCAALIEPGGLLMLSTLNRSAKGFLLGIVGAEFVLRWLPAGTHDWRKFVKPSELAAWLQAEKLTVRDITGLSYNPLSDSFSLNPGDVGVNYFMAAVKQMPVARNQGSE